MKKKILSMSSIFVCALCLCATTHTATAACNGQVGATVQLAGFMLNNGTMNSYNVASYQLGLQDPQGNAASWSPNLLTTQTYQWWWGTPDSWSLQVCGAENTTHVGLYICDHALYNHGFSASYCAKIVCHYQYTTTKSIGSGGAVDTTGIVVAPCSVQYATTGAAANSEVQISVSGTQINQTKGISVQISNSTTRP